MRKSKKQANLIDPTYVLWVFDVMMWLDELDEEQRTAVAKSALVE
jgi:hypothetical protein